MAAGKTSLGKRVARELGIPFVDSDAVFVRRYGVIADFFTTHGEAEFRRLEAEVIAEELAVPGSRIVALGGGAVITESTRRLLEQHPVVLLLTTQDAVLRTANAPAAAARRSGGLGSHPRGAPALLRGGGRRHLPHRSRHQGAARPPGRPVGAGLRAEAQ
jgi:hypothetical protein